MTRPKTIPGDTLSLEARADQLAKDSALPCGFDEFDSIAIVSVVTKLEEELGITVSDDTLSPTYSQWSGHSLVDLWESADNG